MKKVLIIYLLIIGIHDASAQKDSTHIKNAKTLHLTDSIVEPPINDTISTDPRFRKLDKTQSTQKVDTMKLKIATAYAWKITPRLGEQVRIVEDTARFNFHQSSLVDGKDIAMGYLGNLGSPTQTKIFFDRPETSRFLFADLLEYWRKKPEDEVFRNIKVPYSNIHYQSGGGSQRNEEDFKLELSSNFGKKINAGFNFDYRYARGFYRALYNKDVNYDFYFSYIGEKYQMHAVGINSYHVQSENGGISNFLYITNPNSESIKGNAISGNSLEIPVWINGGLINRLRARHIYVTNRYNLGEDMEEYAVNDSITRWRKKENYISPASIILTTHYSDQQRRLIDNGQNTVALDSLFKPYFTNGEFSDQMLKYGGFMNDYFSYYSFKNTLALAMNEGFRSWTKFGLTAFAEFDLRKYALPASIPGLNTFTKDNSFLIGGILSKDKGKYLRYKAWAEKDLLKTDFKLEGELTTILNFKGKEISTKAMGYIKNISPTFYHQHFASKYKTWDMDFDDTRRVFVGGELDVPITKTRIRGGVENLQNYIYSGEDKLMHQSSKNIQVVSLRLDQKFHMGVFNWENQIAYQATADDMLIPLPILSFYTNIYLTTKVAKVLTLQIGADAHFHTSYYMPGYDPLTMQLYNQRDVKMGNFPIATVYLNAHLKNTRFYLMMYNAAEGMGNGESFSLYRYPVAPSMIKMGVSWNFFN